jgi:hypothetical protein
VACSLRHGRRCRCYDDPRLGACDRCRCDPSEYTARRRARVYSFIGAPTGLLLHGRHTFTSHACRGRDRSPSPPTTALIRIQRGRGGAAARTQMPMPMPLQSTTEERASIQTEEKMMDQVSNQVAKSLILGSRCAALALLTRTRPAGEGSWRTTARVRRDPIRSRVAPAEPETQAV